MSEEPRMPPAGEPSPSGMSPILADRLRKAIAYSLAIVLTLLIFRVFGRLADGMQSISDPELYAMLLLGALALLWVRAAKHIRRSPPPPPDGPSQ